MSKVRIVFDGDDKEVVTDSETSLLDASLEEGIQHVHMCNGHGRCSTCRVLVLEGEESLTPPTEAEEKMISNRNFCQMVRLACQTKPNGDAKVRRLVRDELDMTLYAQADGARETEMAILFLDIRSFTPFSERQYPYDVVHILNRFFYTMCAPVYEHHGTIDKYLGDGFMALFGGKGCAKRAVKAAFQMLDKLPDFNEYLKLAYDETFVVGVGIHLGVVVKGNLGHPNQRQTTVIGDTVNMASRVESATKDIGVPFLVSEEVADRLKGLHWPKHTMTIKGKSGEYTLYEPQP